MKHRRILATDSCCRGRSLLNRTAAGALFTLVTLFSSLLPLTEYTTLAHDSLSPHVGPSTVHPLSSEEHATPESLPVTIDFSLTSPDGQPSKEALVAGDYARASFRITNMRTGKPLTSLHPRAWLSARHSEHVARELSCSSKVKNFLRGQLSVQADVDMNSYNLWVLNHDRTVSVINPQIAFNITKLENLIALPAQGLDWALSPDKAWLYITMPEASAVAVIHTTTRTVAHTIHLDQPGTPTRLAFHPDGKSVWIGMDNSPHVAVFDTRTHSISGLVSVEEGLHTLTFSPDGQWAFVTNSASNSVTVIDAQARRALQHVPIPQTPLALAYSPLTGQAYVGAVNGEEVFVIDPSKLQPVLRIPQQPGVTTIEFEPSGRYAFILNQVASQVSILDVTTHSIIGSTSVVHEPDQVAFTPAYAYIRGLGSDRTTLIDLASLTHGKVVPVEIQAGQQPPTAAPDDIGIGRMIAPLPEGHGVMLANAPDMTIYYYMEGMMVPMGTFQTYKRKPHALLILDRMLTETQPGVYSLDIKLPHGGAYDVPILLDNPQKVQCFQVKIESRPEDPQTRETRAITIEPLLSEQPWPPHVPLSVRFRIVDSANSQPITGLHDVQVLLLEPPGTWQQRHVAKETQEGTYEVIQRFPHAGLYILSVKIPSQGLSFSKTSLTRVLIRDIDQLAKRNASTTPSPNTAP